MNISLQLTGNNFQRQFIENIAQYKLKTPGQGNSAKRILICEARGNIKWSVRLGTDFRVLRPVVLGKSKHRNYNF